MRLFPPWALPYPPWFTALGLGVQLITLGGGGHYPREGTPRHWGVVFILSLTTNKKGYKVK
jgi:hypothetical protein